MSEEQVPYGEQESKPEFVIVLECSLHPLLGLGERAVLDDAIRHATAATAQDGRTRVVCQIIGKTEVEPRKARWTPIRKD